MAGSNQRARSGGPKRNRTPSAWPMFLIAHDELVARIEEQLRNKGLPEINWYTVLWVLARAPDERLRMHELSEAAVITRSNLTRLVDRMEKAGLVSRERVSGDRRGAYACLTPAGRDMKTEIWKVYGPAIQEHFTRHLSPQESATLHDIMLRLIGKVRGSRS
jgi:DNA-binding MarR family transcriptional regulator